MNEVRIGIIGIGNMGSNHAKKLIAGDVPRAKLTALCDTDPKRLESFPDQKHFSDGEEMINSGEIDAVIIATPHYSHTTLGIAALKAGLHTLVEKPISVHKADCERLIAAHTDKSKVFAAMFNQRTDPRYVKLRELITSGQLGRINRVNWIITDWFRTATYYSSGGWRATWEGEGGGVLLNQCPHQLDLMQWLFGMPTHVRSYCEIGRYHDIEVDDDVTTYLKYPSGATGVFITTTGEAPGTNRLEVAAEQGKVVIEGEGIKWTRNEKQATEFSNETDKPFAKPETWDISIPTKGFGEQHVGIMKNFVAAILDGAELVAPASEGIHSVELANAMLYSSFTDTTLELPIDAEAYEAHLKKLIANSTHVKKTDEKAGAVDMSGSFSR
ncbi:Gfo/Idh/MocA family protein [Cerasicoccus arenae]|uniref:Oxidoreductase n=1 Tax=Cerasicoccus arenae TaxID=424488 RepID=A0A8J3D941_9BACT|nr:Gfo/Idh/MocA family oxidoreductase [Cerasicoccus arenae]MBK1857012.1 Gfo/Idh/MocA family oxidoreductase [Cerasicoccus arenae]GHB90371.1 oxidoreductase [Cerasicoccus arenae]